MNTSEYSCLLTGVGGQGTVLAARLLGTAALLAGLEVRGSETIGMAQRGGSVSSHVRMGRDIASPLIPRGRADVVIAFEPGEAVRARAFLRPGGTFIVCDRPVIPAVRGDYDGPATVRWLKEHGGARLLSGADIIEHCGARSLNVALLGAALTLASFPFSLTELATALEQRVPKKFLAMNIDALHYGERLITENKSC